MMATAARCPIGGEKIDESAARVNGAITLVVLALAMLTPARWLIAYLIIDFTLKVFAGFAYSPNCWIARYVANAMKLTPNMIDAAPKRFAASIALFMSVASFVAYYGFESVVGFYVLAGTFAVFAALESFAGFCMGCVIFGVLPQNMAMAFVRRGR